MNRLFPIGIIILLCGCTFIPQQVALEPRFMIRNAPEVTQLPIAVEVVDARAEKQFGHRGGLIEGAAITAQQNVAEVLHEAVETGLIRLGFVPVQDRETAARTLTIEIHEITYAASTNLVINRKHTQAVLAATARRGTAIYEHRYHAGADDKVFSPPVARIVWKALEESNQNMVNAAVNGVLTELFSDRELFVFLAAPVAP